MTLANASARLGALTLLLAGAVGAQDRMQGSGIKISKDVPAVSATSTTTEIAVAVEPAILPAFSVAAYGPLNEKNITAIMAGGDSIEIQMGHLAHSKGTAKGVRDFGMMLANDHTAHLAKTQEIIVDEKVGAEPPANDPEGARLKAMLAWLEKTPASKEWDTAFLRFQAQHHQNVIDLFSANIKNAHDDDLEDHIEKTLTSLAKHRDAAKSAATGLGVTTY